MKITVLTGGSSAERSVALASANQMVAALRTLNHDVVVADTTTGFLDPAGERLLLAGSVAAAPADLAPLRQAERRVLLGGLLVDPRLTQADCCLLALHGGTGEDGTIQSLLALAGIRHTGAGALASALAFDKDLSKRVFAQHGIAVAPWRMVVPARGIGDDLDPDRLGDELGWPLVVKPSKQGSTVGLTVVQQPAGLGVAIAEALRFDDEVMIEKFIPGRELTVGVLGDVALAVGEIIPQHDLFDYECKYTPGMSREIFPADLPVAVAREVQELAVRAHRALKVSGYSRVDFRLSPEDRAYCLEVNTLPGMTGTSLMPQSAAAVGLSFGELCQRICQES